MNWAWTSTKSQAASQGIPRCFVPFWTGVQGATALSNHQAVDGIGQWYVI